MRSCLQALVTRGCKLKSQKATVSHPVEWPTLRRPRVPDTDENVELVELNVCPQDVQDVCCQFVHNNARSKTCPTAGKWVSRL